MYHVWFHGFGGIGNELDVLLRFVLLIRHKPRVAVGMNLAQIFSTKIVFSSQAQVNDRQLEDKSGICHVGAAAHHRKIQELG
jgi:hypothetical protein